MASFITCVHDAYGLAGLGGEQISLSIQSKISSNFARAGYDNIETNPSYIGGIVRQHGNLSFARVFQAGHEVPHYQPETAYQIFNRVMFNTDVATGKITTGANYSTSGSVNAFSPSEIPPRLPVQCYLWDILETCGKLERQILTEGTGIIKNFILVGYNLPNGTEVYFDGDGSGGNGGNGSEPGPQNNAASTKTALGALLAGGLLLVAQAALF